MKKLLFSLLLILVMVVGCVQVTDNQRPTVDSFYASPGSISSGRTDRDEGGISQHDNYLYPDSY